MENFFLDNEDLRYYVESGIDWAPLIKLTEHNYQIEGGYKDSQEALNAIQARIEAVGAFSATIIAPLAEQIDRNPPRTKGSEILLTAEQTKINDGLVELGAYGASLPRELLGANAPFVVSLIQGEILARADLSTMAQQSFFGNIALALYLYSVHEGSTTFRINPLRILRTRFAEPIRTILSGKAWGTLAVNETDHAYRDIGAIETIAQCDQIGHWTITGKKSWVLSGHGRFILVLAKTEFDRLDPNPMLNFSLFLVDSSPFERAGVTISSVQEKVGLVGEPSVSLDFNGAPAQLIGARGDGCKLLHLLINYSHIAVGFGGLGLFEAVICQVREFAAHLEYGGHELVESFLADLVTEVQGLRALGLRCAFHEEMAQRLKIQQICGVLDQDEMKLAQKRWVRHQAVTRSLTPLFLYSVIEAVVDAARRNVTLRGAAGYVVGSPAERLLRDAVAMTSFSGPSGPLAIQATKAILLQTMRDPARFAQDYALAKTQAITSLSPLKRRVHQLHSQALHAIYHLMTHIAFCKFRDISDMPITGWNKSLFRDWDAKVDFAPALMHAEHLTELITIRETAKILLEQTEKHAEREDLLKRYLDRNEARALLLHKKIVSASKRVSANPDQKGLSGEAQPESASPSA